MNEPALPTATNLDVVDGALAAENRAAERRAWKLLCERLPWLSGFPTANGLPILDDHRRGEILAFLIDPVQRELVKAILRGQVDELAADGRAVS